MKGRVILWSYVAILLLELYSIFPDQGPEVNRFPFTDFPLTFQVWVDYAAKLLAVIILLWQLRNHLPEHYHNLNVLMWLSVGYLVDYFLIYNLPVGYVFVVGAKIPVSYTLFMLICGGYTVYKSWS